AAQMEALKADPKFMERVSARDPEAFSQYNQLWRISRGLTPEPEPPQTAVHVGAEADERVMRDLQQHSDVLRRQGFDENQINEIVGRRPITMQERDWHQNQINILKRDHAFMQRWAAGDIEAIQKIQRHSVALSLPIGTLEDIERWG